MLKPLQVMVRICRTNLSGAVAENVELIVWGLRAVVFPQDGWKESGCLTENGAGSPKPTWRKSQVARRASATSEKISASNMSHRNWRERINCCHCILSGVEGAAQLLSCTFSFWITVLTYIQNTLQLSEWTNMTLFLYRCRTSIIIFPRTSCQHSLVLIHSWKRSRTNESFHLL